MKCKFFCRRVSILQCYALFWPFENQSLLKDENCPRDFFGKQLSISPNFFLRSFIFFATFSLFSLVCHSIHTTGNYTQLEITHNWKVHTTFILYSVHQKYNHTSIALPQKLLLKWWWYWPQLSLLPTKCSNVFVTG